MHELLSYPPVLRGFLVLVVSGFTFPITGVYLLRMNLLPLRFMLMHGAVLGGAIAIAAKIDPFWTTMTINLLLVWLLSKTSRVMRADTGYISTFIMVAAIGLAFVVISVFNVPAKDSMEMLWGSLYTIGNGKMIGIFFLALFIVAFQYFKRRELKAVFFDAPLAYTSGVNEKQIQQIVVLLTALTVGMAMKMIGALLIDALLILPALIATFHARSFAGMVKWASVWGGLFSVFGFVVSALLKIPVSSAIALIAVLVFVYFYSTKRKA